MSGKGKKKRREGSSSGPSKFIDDEVAETYDKHFLHRALIPERGFQYPGQHIGGHIRERGWGTFTMQPHPFVATIVREFYANASKHQDHQVYVRGKFVNASRQAINEHYDLQPEDERLFSQFQHINADYNEIIRFLCAPDETTRWKGSEGKITNFSSSGLNSYSKAWHYFIIAKLLPSNNTSEVTKERAALNFAIQKYMKIDVGHIVNQSIFHIAKSTKGMQGLGHPHLIFELCVKAGVPKENIEEWVNPKTALTETKIAAYSSRLQKEGIAPPSPSSPRVPPAAVGSSSRGKEPELNLQEENEERKKENKKMLRRVEHIMKEQSKERHNQWAIMDSMNKILLGMNPDYQHPPLKQYSPYVSPETDDDESDEF